MNMKNLFHYSTSLSYLLFFLIEISPTGCHTDTDGITAELRTVPPASIRMEGELLKRMLKNQQALSSRKEETETTASSSDNLKTGFPEKSDIDYWKHYQMYGMSENHENYESFHIYDQSTSPAAVIRSYLYVTTLWQQTRQEKFRDEAELIYYNGICHLQQPDGNWGSDNTPGNKIQDVCLKTIRKKSSPEETGYCTRGLQQIADRSYFIAGSTLYIPFLRESRLELSDQEKLLKLQQQTRYPFGNSVSITIKNNSWGIDHLMIAAPEWTSNHLLTLNGETITSTLTHGFLDLKRNLKDGDRIRLSFTLNLRIVRPINKENTNLDQLKIYYGPLLLSYNGPEVIKLTTPENIIQLDSISFRIENKDITLRPVYRHPDNNEEKENRKKQILF